MADLPQLSDFPQIAREKLRYSDTDRQGHVNNAIFSTLLETGRVEFMYAGGQPLHDPNCALVVVNLQIDFLAEMTWPGEVQIGTAITGLGGSSIKVAQAIFQDGRCRARASNVLVQMNQITRRSQPFSDDLRARLEALQT